MLLAEAVPSGTVCATPVLSDIDDLGSHGRKVVQFYLLICLILVKSQKQLKHGQNENILSFISKSITRYGNRNNPSMVQLHVKIVVHCKT